PFASSMPSRAQNSFQAHSFLFFASTTLPGSMVRSFGSAPTFGATFLNRSSRAACAASSAAGACDGQVVLPPEPVEKPRLLSPILTTGSVGWRPRTSAATIAVTVRWAVPRSCVEVSAVTLPSRLMVTLHSFGVAPPAAFPPQVCSAIPMPCLKTPLLAPGGCHFAFHPDSFTTTSCCAVYKEL